MTPYYKTQLERGLIYQDFVYEILHKHGISTVAYGSKVFQQRVGENKAQIEIKFDDKYATTGNLWIEASEKSDPRNADYVTSGIYRDCVEYVIGDYDTIFRFATQILRLTARSGKYRLIENGLKSSRGYLLPSKDAHRIATQVYRPQCGAEMREILIQSEQDRVAAKAQMVALMQAMQCDPGQGTLFGAADA